MGTFNATFTLTVGSSANVGGFNIVGNPGSVSIATGVSRASLAGGVTYSDIADTVTEFTITSTGDCTNSITKEVAPSITPTPEVTSFAYEIEPSGNATASSSCSIFISTLPTVVYAASQFPNGVVQFFTDPGLTIGFGGSGDFHAYRRDFEDNAALKTARVSAGGFTSEIANCTL
jgi:hypothetical protein